MKIKSNLKTKITGILSNRTHDIIRLSECSMSYAADITKKYNALMGTSWKISEERGIISFFIEESTPRSALEVVTLIRKGIKSESPVTHLIEELCKIYGGSFCKNEATVAAPERIDESYLDPENPNYIL